MGKKSQTIRQMCKTMGGIPEFAGLSIHIYALESKLKVTKLGLLQDHLKMLFKLFCVLWGTFWV